MPALVIESLEGIIIVPCSCLQFLHHLRVLLRDLHHVDVLKSFAFIILVVREDVVVVRAFAYVQHSLVLTVDKNHRWLPCLPVEVGILSHHALDDGVTHVESAKVVARVTQHEALKLCESRFLFREELILKTFCPEAFIGINHQCLQGMLTRLSSGHARLAELVEGARRTCVVKILKVDGASPVVLVILVGIVCNDADGIVVQITVVCDDRDYRNSKVTSEENVRLCCGYWRQIAVAEQFRAYHTIAAYHHRRRVERA